MSVLYIALFGALGALSRYGLSFGIHTFMPRDFPYGTMVVNILGSFAIGLLHVYLIERTQLEPTLRIGLLIGFLGAFTTFSTFSMETLQLLEAGQHIKAFANILLTVTICLSATYLGLLVARGVQPY